jgi:hypothetical protein
MPYSQSNQEWTAKGSTLSHKTAFDEYGLTLEVITKAINEGKLQYREGSIYGNPWLRLLRSEVEKLAEEIFGKALFEKKQAMKELKAVNKELKELQSKVSVLEIRKIRLTEIIN